jgi:phosphatidylglycerol:prolipoprotein diacylglycerol transferase
MILATLPYPHFDPVLVQLGPLAIRWYALAYIFGLLLGWGGIILILRKKRLWAAPPYNGKPPATEDQIGDLVVWMTFGIILGGRFGWDLIYGVILCSVSPYADFCRGLPMAFVTNPIKLIAAWEGGMSFHGGLLGVLAAGWIWTRRHGIHFFDAIDFVAPLVPIGLGLGRLGNFIGGELWGRHTDGPWGMIFPRALDALAKSSDELRAMYLSGQLSAEARHPSQLYEFALEGVVMFAVLWWYSRKPRPRYAVSGLFALLYGCFRFAVEFVREPDAQLGYLAFGWLTMGQVLSLPLIVTGLLLLWLSRNAPTLRLYTVVMPEQGESTEQGKR